LGVHRFSVFKQGLFPLRYGTGFWRFTRFFFLLSLNGQLKPNSWIPEIAFGLLAWEVLTVLYGENISLAS